MSHARNDAETCEVRGILGDMGDYEFFDHAADVGIRLCAGSLEDLFLTAAQALMAWIGPPPQGNLAEQKVSISAEDLEELLLRWLQEVLCLFQLAHGYFTGAREISVDVGLGKLDASVILCEWTEDKHREYQEVKAITYHKLKVDREGPLWVANVILDV